MKNFKKFSKVTKIVVMVVVVLGAGLGLAGCTVNSESTANQEQKLTEENQGKLLQTQPPMRLDWSLERENINKRTELWNDTNKISYIYLVSYGKVMTFYTIKGKVSSVNSQITNPEQAVDDPHGSYESGSVTLPSPAEDGSYGTNGDAVFFFTTEGAYVEWNGEYMLADQPLSLKTQPELTRIIK